MAKKDQKKTENKDKVDPRLAEARSILKQYDGSKQGKGSLFMFTDVVSKTSPSLQTFTTGSPDIDDIIGVGGIPVGRIIEIFGPESGGKTTIALNCLKGAILAGHAAAFVDAEYALDRVWTERIGIPKNKLLILQPESGESVFQFIEDAIKLTQIRVFVVDSVAALVPQKELDEHIGEKQNISLIARLMSTGLRKLNNLVANAGATVIFVNQIREKVGGYGNPEDTTGGRALKFYSSVRLEVRRKKYIVESEENVGALTRVKCIKNKVAPPMRECEVSIYYYRGLDTSDGFLKRLVDQGWVEKTGNWYLFEATDDLPELRENGRRAFIDAITPEHQIFFDEIVLKRLERYADDELVAADLSDLIDDGQTEDDEN